jgi:hypothetical protein
MIKTPEYQAIWNDLLEKQKANLAGTMAKITKETLLADLAKIRKEIDDIKTYGGTEGVRKRLAKIKAIESIAKLSGLLEDKVTLTHQGPLVVLAAPLASQNVNLVPEQKDEPRAPVETKAKLVPQEASQSVDTNPIIQLADNNGNS